jgi:hypothetical protein
MAPTLDQQAFLGSRAVAVQEALPDMAPEALAAVARHFRVALAVAVQDLPQQEPPGATPEALAVPEGWATGGTINHPPVAVAAAPVGAAS